MQILTKMLSIIGSDFTQNYKLLESNGIHSARCVFGQESSAIDNEVERLVKDEFDALVAQSDGRKICIDGWDTRFVQTHFSYGERFHRYGLRELIEDYPHVDIRVVDSDEVLIMQKNGDVAISTADRRYSESLGDPSKIILVSNSSGTIPRAVSCRVGEDSIVNASSLEELVGDKILTYTLLSNTHAKKHVIPFLWGQGILSLKMIRESFRILQVGEIIVKPSRGYQGIGVKYLSRHMGESYISSIIRSCYEEIHDAPRAYVHEDRWVFQEYVPGITLRGITLGARFTHCYARTHPKMLVKSGEELNYPVASKKIKGLVDASLNVARIIQSNVHYLDQIMAEAKSFQI